MFGLGGFGESEDGGDDGGMGLWGALGTAGMALLGGLGGYQGQKDTNETNLTLGREQMGFQERMSNTSYQRAIEDMKKAGINPMLSAKVGGASTPPGSMPQIQNAVGAGISSAAQGTGMMTAAQQIMQSKAQTDNIAAQTDKIKSETMEKQLVTAKMAADVEKLTSSAGVDRQQMQKIANEILGVIADSASKHAMFNEMNKGGFAADVARRKAESEIARYNVSAAKQESKFYESDFGADSPYIKRILDIVRGISSATGAARTMSGR